MFFNKDIMDFKEFPNYDIIWTDPPWEQRMVKYFETLMVKDGYKRPNNTLNDIISQLARLSSTNKPIFIEYSLEGSELVIDIMKGYGHTYYASVSSLQENGNSYIILVFNSNYVPDGNNRGQLIIESVCRNFNFNVVFDPFAGIGRTCKSFISCGKKYIGNEINPKRFNRLKNSYGKNSSKRY